MSKIFWGLVLLLSFGFAQAQLVPKGMVLSGDTTTITADSSSENSNEVDNVVIPPFSGEPEEAPANLVETKPTLSDSVNTFRKNYDENIGKANDFDRYSSIASWSSLGFYVAALGMLAAGGGNVHSAWTVGTIACAGAGIASNILSISFDVVSHAYHVKAGNAKLNLSRENQDKLNIPVVRE